MDNCARCGTERPWLHKHHIKPRSEGGTDDPDNLTRICANCHEDVHGGPCGGTSRGALAHTPEARAKKSASLKRSWQDPEVRERQRAARVAAHARDPERRQRQAERMRQWYLEHPEEAAERARKISETRKRKGLRPGQRLDDSVGSAP